jgi:DNA repair photolyase
MQGRSCERLLGQEQASSLGLAGRKAIYMGPAVSRQVIFASAFVDVAATRELALETVEMCDLVLKLSDFQIRLLSKSPLLYEVVARQLAGRNPQAKARVIFGLSTGTFDDEVARAIEPDAPSPSRRLEALKALQAESFRTFGMICPILPQADPGSFARRALKLLHAERCELIWAEPVNPRTKRNSRGKENSFLDTLSALRSLVERGHADRQLAERFEEVVSDKAAWNSYCRETFKAFAEAAPRGKLRWMQYPSTDKEIRWWLSRRKEGALVLGRHVSSFLRRVAEKRHSSPD